MLALLWIHSARSFPYSQPGVAVYFSKDLKHWCKHDYFCRLFQQDICISTQHIDGKVGSLCWMYHNIPIAWIDSKTDSHNNQPVQDITTSRYRAKISGICLGEDPKHSVTNNNLWELPWYQGSALQIPDPRSQIPQALARSDVWRLRELPVAPNPTNPRALSRLKHQKHYC